MCVLSGPKSEDRSSDIQPGFLAEICIEMLEMVLHARHVTDGGCSRILCDTAKSTREHNAGGNALTVFSDGYP